MTFAYTTTPCTFCDSGKATLIESIGFYSIVCPECDGAGEVDASCAECSCITPINADGLCERCNDANELTLVAFEAKYLGGGRWQVAA